MEYLPINHLATAFIEYLIALRISFSSLINFSLLFVIISPKIILYSQWLSATV
jgi:hypothetical protein